MFGYVIPFVIRSRLCSDGNHGIESFLNSLALFYYRNGTKYCVILLKKNKRVCVCVCAISNGNKIVKIYNNAIDSIALLKVWSKKKKKNACVCMSIDGEYRENGFRNANEPLKYSIKMYCVRITID